MGFLLILGGTNSLLPLGFSHLGLLVPLGHDVLQGCSNNGTLEILGTASPLLGHILLKTLLVLPHPQGPYAEEEPQEDHLDCSLPQEAQEGSRGGCDQEEDSPCPEVPACRRWSNPAGHHGQEEPEA